MKVFLAALMLLAPALAQAATPLELYQQGHYDDAVAAGTAQNDASGFAIAARSELAAEMMRDTPCLDCLRRAEDDARKAIAADANLVDGHVLLAGALGYEARVLGKAIAMSRNLAGKAQEQLALARQLAPKEARVWAASGGWNIEVVRNGGATMARWMFGATIEEGLGDFKKAFALTPNDLVIRYQYALSLGGYDAQTYRADIEDALARTQSLKPQTAYEHFAQNCAVQLRDALKHNDTGRFDALVKKFQGYP